MLFRSNIQASTSSLNTFSASALTRLSRIEESTASLNTYTGSQTTTNTANTARFQRIEESTSSLNTLTASLATTYEARANATKVLVSGSSQVNFTQLSGISANIISASTNSTNVNFTISGGSITANLIGGVVSGSGQLGNYVATITGTTNQITVAGSGGNNAAVTLSTPQNIHTGADFRVNSLGVGMAASATAGRIDATGDIVAYSSSDRRFKDNIQPIQNALNKIESVGGYEFDWNKENKIEHGYEGHDIGVIAQEIEEIAPELVSTRENGYKAVKYEKIVPLLIQAIKELSAKIKELENK